MTGGQPHDGELSVPRIVRQLRPRASNDRRGHRRHRPRLWPRRPVPWVPVRHRDELDAIQRDLRQTRGRVRADLRPDLRRREAPPSQARPLPDPARRVFINEMVCEGCGDCGDKSNCMSIVPVNTEFGRKRAIDQSSCNKDYSCLNGFCPSFITVEGASYARAPPSRPTNRTSPLPMPTIPPTARFLRGDGDRHRRHRRGHHRRAHRHGGPPRRQGCDGARQTGLAQKGGSVFSHVRIADRPDDLHAVRIAAGEADAVIGGDVVVSASVEALAKMAAGKTRLVVNCAETPTSEFTRNPRLAVSACQDADEHPRSSGKGRRGFSRRPATGHRPHGRLDRHQPFLLGYAWQRAMVPVSHAALQKAIELNAVAVDMNRKAFLWGVARPVDDLPAVLQIRSADPGGASAPNRSTRSSGAAKPFSPTTRTLPTRRFTASWSNACGRPKHRWAAPA